MTGGYEYLNARAKGLMGRLLSPPQLKELARLPEISAFLVALTRSTPYRPVPSATASGASLAGAEDVEPALNERLSAILGSLWREADPEPKRWLEPWLGRWDMDNIKKILRVLLAPGSAELAGRPPSPSVILTGQELANLSAAGSVGALARRLSGRGGLWNALAEALRRPEETPRAIEERLDLSWAQYAAARAAEKAQEAPVFAEFLASYIDSRNILTALRLAKAGGSEPAPFLPGGRRLGKDRWEELATRSNLDHALALLETTPFWEAVREEAPPYEAEKALGRIEHRLETMALERGGHIYRRSDPLGVSVLLRYAQLLANEVRNLRQIAEGLWRRLPSGLIEERLILAQG
jgi:vacuolar-type H+-ATPase subunit C/Vma6